MDEPGSVTGHFARVVFHSDSTISSLNRHSTPGMQPGRRQ
jgi:hypothetical protein